ncbi:MAG: hypothetical protein DRJ03_17255 [Chloroflexi bacterium]|nr:MAG: hypothetical protein DRJ03_17255 [Chloroflexota bacterium]
MKRKALSFVLGLLVLLTAFGVGSSYVKAETYVFDFDDNVNVWVETGVSPAAGYHLNATIQIDDINYKRYSFDLKILRMAQSSEGFLIGFTGGYAWPFEALCFTNGNQPDTSAVKFAIDHPSVVAEFGTVPVDVWLHFEYETFLGEDGTGKYVKLVVTNKETGEVVINKTVTATEFYGGPFGLYARYGSATVENGMTRILFDNNNGEAYLDNLVIGDLEYQVTFNLKDALTGESLLEVTVKEGNTTLGTISDGGSLELARGTHTLTFEKSGYWSVTKTIDVQSDMSVTVEMYPSSTAFQFLNFPSDIQVYENSIYELTFTLSPISTQATYNTYLSLSGLSDVLEVRKDGSVISPEGGKYYLGDISSPVQVSIKFKAGSVGTHGFTLTLTSNDAIMSKTYTTTKQVTYQVEPLPFSVQMPSEWQVGQNELRISESSGQSYLITAALKDSSGNEVWSDSHAFSPYEAHTFSINIPSEGSYTLELQFNGQTAVYDIQVNPAITLLTETITAKEGDIATVQVKLKNPSSNTKYYTIVLEGHIIEGNVSKSVSVAPLSEKTVDLAFQVPNDLEYDAYDLTLKVLEGDSVQFQDTIHLVIDSGGFSIPIGGESSSWLWIIGGLLVLGLGIWALRRR